MQRLQEQHDKLTKLYEEHEDEVRSLQRQAMQEIVPDVMISLELSEDEAEWVNDYLRDAGTLFRIFRRQKFITSFTHEALRSSVVWRLKVLKPAISRVMMADSSTNNLRKKKARRVTMSHCPGLSALRCLPLEYVDNLGRPLAVLRVSELDFTADSELLKGDIILSLERLRVSLQRMNEQKLLGISVDSIAEGLPVLQYVVVLDLENVSTKSIPIELIQWYLREVQPWYHGMIGAAFIINYNWAHSGLWSILKHILPASAIAKVAFPSTTELATFIPDGILPLVFEALKNPAPLPRPNLDIEQQEKPSASRTPSPSASSASSLPQLSTESKPQKRPKLKRARNPSSRFSIDNPFYGYPLEVVDHDDTRGRSRGPRTSTGDDSSQIHNDPHSDAYLIPRRSEHGVPRLRHGRRRKRDLAKTLLMLYWQQWKTQISIGTILIVAFGLFKLTRFFKRGQIPGIGLFASRVSKLLTRS